MSALVATYESDRDAARSAQMATRDSTKISWNRGLLNDLDRGIKRSYRQSALRTAVYRPFTRQAVYFDRPLNDMVYRLESLFPTPQHANVGFVVMAPRADNITFGTLVVDDIPDLSFYTYTGQFFARWRYELVEREDGILALDTSGDSEVVDGYRKIDNITEAALEGFRAAHGDSFTKDDVFFYVYGLLHSPDYRETYAADLKKSLPRIPLVEDASPFVETGKTLMELHLGYETVTPYSLDGLATDDESADDPYEHYRVEKEAFAKVRDPETKKLVAGKSTIIYNQRITLSGIPEDAHRYMLGSRSAIEWIIDRYQVKTDTASGIVNDPNDWSREVGDPRYIIDLLARIVTVSLETMKIVDALPPLPIRKPPS